ncbi:MULTISPECIES: acetylxylan esterase [unclassified Pseudonocardia]|uniref:glucuronyl esterase domain-containing protein n=1 Tax=unclassified Pseudonocardia TaxID=2619320 RepID=UPI00031056D6|nr:acetylxylan esterase [Pseudonocardia sp. Ae707_Ps1]
MAIAVSVLILAAALMPNDRLDAVDRSAASRVLAPPAPLTPAPARLAPADDARIDGVDVPDPLVLDSGDPVDTVQEWEQQRRPELVAAFEENVYGTSLPLPEDIAFDENGEGRARTTTVTVTGPEGTASFTVRLFLPEGTPKGTFLLIDHRGSVGDDAGSSSGYAPVSTILDAGYAFAALDAGEVAPDDPGSYRDGVINAFYPAGTDLPEDAGRTISAWAWGASRALDYLETVPGIEAAGVAVIGHSRGGKAALWAGAQDTRFPVVISNNSGSTGAKLARRDGAGESLAAINEQFPHWFPETYKAYNDDPDSLPVDQHQLLALIAPGRVVIGSASDDGNADPQGEHMSYLGAAPVYELYGLSDTGLATQSWPPTTDRAFRGPGMSYHLRSGGHGLQDTDWNIYLEGDLFRR